MADLDHSQQILYVGGKFRDFKRISLRRNQRSRFFFVFSAKLRPETFRPWLNTSQACESYFRGVNTGFATLERPDGSIQVVSKQTLCWFLEEKTWKRSSDRKFRFQSSPAGFYQIKKNPKKVEKITLETGHWAVFGTEDGKNYRLGQVLALVAIKSNSFVSECRGDETIDIGAICHWLDFERKKGKLTGNLIRTSMFNNGYYPCKYYKCSCPTPNQVKVDGQLCLTFNQSIVSQLSAFFRV